MLRLEIFGACLMTQPRLVAECVSEMKASCSIPVTVKPEIGVNDVDRYEDMLRFIEVVSQSNSIVFPYLSPTLVTGAVSKTNRNVPPLRYQEVYDVKKVFPHLLIVNGGIQDACGLPTAFATC